MKRQVSLEEISDGRLYVRRDLARIGCGGCRGCSSCCRGMGNTVVLDPVDMYRLSEGVGETAQELLAEKLELNVVDGMILPNLKMGGEEEACGFLDAEGRCSVHPFRPGICRMFPLGRYYEEKEGGRGEAADFRYFVQAKECPFPNKTKVRIAKWLDIEEPERYEACILEWHNLLALAEERAKKVGETEEKNICLYILKLFYLKQYEKGKDFYGQLEERMKEARQLLWQIG